MSSSNLFGFIALLLYFFTLLPSNIKILLPKAKKWQITKLLFKNRRNLGLISFFIALIHILIVSCKYQISFFEINTYSKYYTGIFTTVIFAILALTSNNWSIKKLKSEWKKLHQLTYIALILLIMHISSIMHIWSYFTYVGFFALCLMAATYLIRLSKSFIQPIDILAKQK